VVEVAGRPGLHPAGARPAAEGLERYHSGTMRGILDGRPVRLRSRRGTITARARVTAGIAAGTVFAPFHFAETAANLLTHAEYKVCAVAIEPADADSGTGSAGVPAS